MSSNRDKLRAKLKKFYPSLGPITDTCEAFYADLLRKCLNGEPVVNAGILPETKSSISTNDTYDIQKDFQIVDDELFIKNKYNMRNRSMNEQSNEIIRNRYISEKSSTPKDHNNTNDYSFVKSKNSNIKSRPSTFEYAKKNYSKKYHKVDESKLKFSRAKFPVQNRESNFLANYLQNFEPNDETSPELTEKLLDLKEDLKLVRRIEKEGVFGFMGIQESNLIVFDNVQSSIIAFPTTWLVETGFSAVVDIFSKKRSKLDVNNRGIMRLRLNKLIEIDYDSLCNIHKCQGSH
ncbi:hypothetical protein A3Q56_04160 [Intoshia linei]|uniref:Uncharacterized protein n=1 Tax=Intoshia linei TaxID=1819745 RepID=A0A177B2Z9_9BILA|nr:hypothetical protein A3Q56_04160 [Intoshia linei]